MHHNDDNGGRGRWPKSSTGGVPVRTMMGWTPTHQRSVPAQNYLQGHQDTRRDRVEPNPFAKTFTDPQPAWLANYQAEGSRPNPAPHIQQAQGYQYAEDDDPTFLAPQGMSAQRIAAPQHSAPSHQYQQQNQAPQQSYQAPQQSYQAPQQSYQAPQQSYGQHGYGQQSYGAPQQQSYHAPQPEPGPAPAMPASFQGNNNGFAPQPQPTYNPGGYGAYSPSQPGPGPANPVYELPHFVQPEFASGTEEVERSSNERSIPTANATVGRNDRVRFIRLTYLHLLFAIMAFAGLEYLFLRTSLGEPVVKLVFYPMMKLGGRAGWAVILAAFVGGGYLAEKWARSNTSSGVQYAGLAFYVVLEALIFIPLLVIAELKAAEYAAKYGSEAHFIRDAAFITLALFAGLTASVLLSRKDFSFLRSSLFAGTSVAASLIVMSLVFGFSLGMVFSAGMIVLAGGYVLYYTSNVLAHYRPTQHVAASLALFSALALMFWYVIRLLMRLRQ